MRVLIFVALCAISTTPGTALTEPKEKKYIQYGGQTQQQVQSQGHHDGGNGQHGNDAYCGCHRYEEELTDLKSQLEYAAKGWYRADNGLYYKFFEHEKVTYDTARDRCEDLHARLASTGLRSLEIRKEIRRLLPYKFPNMWIGLDSEASQEHYKWSDGVLSTRKNTDWYGKEPNVRNFRCAAMWGGYKGQVNDANCNSKYQYICEADPKTDANRD